MIDDTTLAAPVEPNGGSDTGAAPPEPDSSLDTGAEPIPEPTGDTPEGTEPAPDGKDPASSTDPKEDGRIIPPWLRDLKDKNPAAFAKAKTDLFDLRDRRSVHPTVQAAREEHELLQANGGVAGIAKLREDGTFFKSAAEQFLKGDPAFVKDLFEEDPIAAAQHVPIMLDAFKERDKDGYNATIARLWDNEFKAVQFDTGVANLIAAIKAKDLDSAMQWAESFGKWQQTISGHARRAEDPRVKALLTERNQRFANEAKTARDESFKSYRTDATNEVVTSMEKVFDDYFKNRKGMDAEDRGDLLREATARANRDVENTPGFKEQRDKLLQAGDFEGAKRLLKTTFAKHAPEAVKRIARRYGTLAGPAVPAKDLKQPTPGQRPAAPSAGFVQVNTRPQAEEIDRNATPNEMIISGRAVLKNGRKVSWAHLKKAS